MSASAAGLVGALASAFPWLAAWGIAATVVLLAALGAGSLVRHDARGRVALWRTTVVALVVLPVLSLGPGDGRVAVPGIAPLRGQLRAVLPAGGSFTTPPPGIVPGSWPAPGVVSGPEGGPRGLDAVLGARTPRRRPAPEAPRWPEASLPALAFGVWALGAATLLVHLLAGFVTLRRHGRSAEPVGGEILNRLGSGGTGPGPGTTARIVRGGPFGVPVCWGVRRTTILLPERSRHWTAELTRVVLAHELAHAGRRDGLYRVLCRVAVAMHWYNPLVWLLARRLERDTEDLCDEIVVRTGIAPRRYARGLLRAAREARSARGPAPAVSMARAGSLERRVRRILEGRRSPVRSVAGACGAAAVLVVTLAAALAATPPLPPGAAGASAPTDTATARRIVEGLTRALADRAPDVRRSAVNSLRDLGTSRALQAVGSALADPDDDVRRAAEEVLGLRPRRPDMVIPTVGSPPSTPDAVLRSLEDALADPDPRERVRAARSLGNRGDARSTSGLVRALADPDARVRTAGAAALGNIRDPASLPALVRALRDPDDDVRREAAAALGNLGDPRAAGPLRAAWPDPDDHVRANLVSALGRLGDPAAAPVVLAALTDPAPQVRRNAAGALGALGRALVTEPGEDLPRPTPSRVTGSTPCAAPSPPPPPGTDLATVVDTLLRSPEADRREWAARTLEVLAPEPGGVPMPSRDGGAPGKDHHHALAVGLGDPATAVRVAAACALARVGDGRALEPLASRAGPREAEALREAARWAMARIEERLRGSSR